MARPIAIFDKSFLHALNADESEVYDLLFVNNIVPTFYVEVLGDLEKEKLNKEAQEAKVSELSAKTPHYHPYENINYHMLCVYDLLGYPVEMSYKPVCYPGRAVEIDGEQHVFNDVSPEQGLFDRWSRGIFLQEEQNLAKQYRENLKAIPKIDQLIINKLDISQKFHLLKEIKPLHIK